MSYNKALIKSITDLLSVLSEIEIDDNGDNSGEIVLDDGSVMTLSMATDKDHNSLHVERISVTNARLNLDLIVSRKEQSSLSKDGNAIRLVKKKPDKIFVTLKKKNK